MTADDLLQTENGVPMCPYCGSFDVYYDETSEEWECAGCLDYLYE